MTTIFQVLFSFATPPGIWVSFIIGITVYLYYKKRLNRRRIFVLAGSFILLYSSSISLVSDLLLRSIEGLHHPPITVEGDVIIMLTGGATRDTPWIGGQGNPSGETASRLLAAAALHRELKIPIILAGGKVYSDTGNESEVCRRWLIAMGIPESEIYIEPNSKSTAENAQYVKQILNQRKFDKPILVSSAHHMARAVKSFESINVEVLPYPTGYKVSRELDLYPERFYPSYAAVNNTGHALKEYLGLLLLYVTGG